MPPPPRTVPAGMPDLPLHAFARDLIDGTELGTLELDATGAALGSRGRAGGLWRTSLEAEWRPIDRLGIGAELGTAGALDGAAPREPQAFTSRGAFSYVVLRDRPRNDLRPSRDVVAPSIR